MANCGLVLNDGSSFILLNDGTSALILNDNSCLVEPGQGSGGGHALWDIQHRGSRYWKKYQEELRNKKKKKTKKEKLLEELDEHLIELNARVDETPVEAIEPSWVADLRRAESFAYNELVAQHTIKEIEVYVTVLREIAREMDDEDAIILAIH
jgi:hypothetical protein